MAVKDWWNALTSEWGWGDDDDSAFDDDLWADLGIDPESIGTGSTITPTAEDDPYGIGSLFDPAPNIYGDEDWATTYDFGDWGAPAEDFEDSSFDYSSFDIDAYLDSILNPDYGESYTEGDPSNWFINTGDDSGGGGGIGDSGWTGWGADATGAAATGAGDVGPLGGPIGPWLRDLFLGEGGLRGRGEGEGIGGIGGGILDLLGSLFGGANKAVGGIGSGIGSLLNSPLGQLAMLNYMKNKNKDVMDIPVGYGDGGGGGGDGSPIDYRTFNLQPALMPGVAYANVAPPVPPPEMRGGGLGDVTLAKLEPGEFVMTKKATDNIGAQNLYRMMKQAEGRG